MNKSYDIKGYFTCDFETANNPKLNEEETYVWLACAYDILEDKIVNVSFNIADFFNNFIYKNPNAYFYFHNLAFDGTFILDYLIRQGFKPLNYIDDYKDKTFKSCIDNMGKYYYIDIVLRDKERNCFKHFKIFDSYKLVPLSEKKIAESFKMETLKGKIDYKKERPKDYIATEEEIAYIENDTKINGRAIKFFLDNDLLHGFTIGQCAFEEWTKTQPKWRTLLPLLDKEVDYFCRKAYKGGWCYVNPKFQNIELGEGCVYDANSLYPSQMILKALPYGSPTYFKGNPRVQDLGLNKLFIVHVVADISLKEGFLPTIQVKGSGIYSDTEYLTQTLEPLDLYLTNVDLDLMLDHYNILSLEYVDGYTFKSTHKLFTEYVNKFQKMKIENDKNPGLRQIAKLFLNNLYGQMVKRPVREAKIPTLNEEGVLTYTRGSPYYIESNYTPVGAFITAYGRAETISKAQANIDRFIYSDTDSVHLLGLEEPKEIPIDSVKFGCWKCETKFIKAKYLRAKTYMEELADGSRIVRVAGLPSEISDTISMEEFNQGASFNGKLVPKKVKGGTILKETTYKIKKEEKK